MEKRSRVMRIGIAGLGAGAVNALAATPGLTNHPNIQLVAAADLRPEARDAFASLCGGRTHAGVEEMCKASDIDAVYILTPNALHAEHAIIAAEHGKQVIADKPMALTLDDCDAMIRAAERRGVRLLIGHSQSLDSGILKMIEIIRSGVLGRPIMIASSYYNDWLYRPRSRDELDPSTLEGSLVLRQGAVQLDTVRMLGGGMVRSVHGTTIVADPARRVEGAYAAYLEFEDGTPATVPFDSHGHFDSAELTYGIGLQGRPATRRQSPGRIAEPGASPRRKTNTRSRTPPAWAAGAVGRDPMRRPRTPVLRPDHRQLPEPRAPCAKALTGSRCAARTRGTRRRSHRACTPNWT